MSWLTPIHGGLIDTVKARICNISVLMLDVSPSAGQVMAPTLGTHVDERGWDGVDIDTDDIIIHPVYLRARLILIFNNWSKMTSVH